MIKFVLPALAGIAAGLCMNAPLQAQSKTLIIYGNDKCPEGTICVRAPESERYRIPQTLRQGALTPTQQSWAARGTSVASAGAATGTGSCTPVGGGGNTGCWKRDMQQARATNKQTATDTANSSVPQ